MRCKGSARIRNAKEKPNRRGEGRVAIEQDHFAGLKTLAEMCEKRLKLRYLPLNIGRFRNQGHMPDRLCRNTFLVQTQPCRQTLSFCSSRHAIICVALENTASISTDSIGSVGCSGRITRLTKKCFCLANCLTVVHLVSSSFLGFRGVHG